MVARVAIGLRQALAFNFAAAYAVFAALVGLLALQRQPTPTTPD